MQKLLSSMNDVEIVKEPGDPNDLIGYGALSQVRKVRHKATGKMYALKEMDLKAIHPNDIKNITREIKTHIFLDHPNIVKLYDNYTGPNNVLCLLLEYCDNNNLFYFIQKSRIDEKLIHKFFFQTVQAIEYIHKRKIMHRDLKPENILLDKNLNVKVCDFGWCAEYNENERRQTFCGTNEYMAPEILQTKTQDFGIDIWAMGILLYEMYHKKAPFTGRSPHEIDKAIKARRLVFTANPMCSEAKDIIDKILQIDPKKRLTIEQIYAHPYFHKFPFFRLMTNDFKAIAAKNSRASYVGNEEGRELLNALNKKARAPSPGRTNGVTMTENKSNGMQPVKITSYKEATTITNERPTNQLTGVASLQTSSILADLRPKAITTMTGGGLSNPSAINISTTAIKQHTSDWTPSNTTRPQLVNTISTPAQVSTQSNGGNSLNSSQLPQKNIGMSFTNNSSLLGQLKTSSIGNIYDYGKTLTQPMSTQIAQSTDRKGSNTESTQGGRPSSEKERTTMEFQPYKNETSYQKEEEKPAQQPQTTTQQPQHTTQQPFTFTGSYQNTILGQTLNKESTALGNQGSSGQVLLQASHLTSVPSTQQLSGNYQATSYTSPGQVITTTTPTSVNGGAYSNLTQTPSKNQGNQLTPTNDPYLAQARQLDIGSSQITGGQYTKQETRPEEYKPMMHTTNSTPAIHNIGSPILSFPSSSVNPSTHQYPYWQNQGSTMGQTSTVISSHQGGFSSPQLQMGQPRYTLPMATPSSTTTDWKYNISSTGIKPTTSFGIEQPHTSITTQPTVIRGSDGRVSYNKVGDTMAQMRSPLMGPIQMGTTSSYMVSHQPQSHLTTPMQSSYTVQQSQPQTQPGVNLGPSNVLPTTTFSYQSKPFSQGYNH